MPNSSRPVLQWWGNRVSLDLMCRHPAQSALLTSLDEYSGPVTQSLKHVPFLWRVDPPAHLSAWPHALLKHPVSMLGAQKCQQEGEVCVHSQQCFSFEDIPGQGDTAFPWCVSCGGQPFSNTWVAVSGRNIFTWWCLLYKLGAVMTYTKTHFY